MTFDLAEFIRESNLIEGIDRPTTAQEIEAAEHFLALDEIGAIDMIELVGQIQPGTLIRSQLGMDRQIGNHVTPPGGEGVIAGLTNLLLVIKDHGVSPYNAHCAYASLHPFMDCNGRSSRLLWLWMMGGETRLPFLRWFYYQSLSRHDGD